MANHLVNNKSIHIAGTFADITALQALDTTSLPAFIWAYIDDSGKGEYFLDRDSVQTESHPDIIAPTTGPGRWIKKNDTIISDYNLIKKLTLSEALPFTASNGVVKVGDDFQLGGTLSSDISIEGNQKKIEFNNLSNYYGFSAESKNGTVTSRLGVTSYMSGVYLSTSNSSTNLNTEIRIASGGVAYISSSVSGGDSGQVNVGAGYVYMSAVIGGVDKRIQISANGIEIRTGSSTYYAYLKTTNLTANRTIEFPNTGGTLALTSDIPAMVDAYLTAGAVTALLENTSNWTGKVYTGTAITGTYQGQKWYNGDYLFEAIQDNTWIRLTRG